ncbi:MAG: glycoside hydrolase family 32 protein [Pirellulales bacterium]
MRLALMLLAAVSFADNVARGADDIVVADFEGPDYRGWKATGEAFGPGPARGTLSGQMELSGYEGKGLVNSFFKGDDATGTLTSASFALERDYLAFLIGGGMHPGKTCMNLIVAGRVVLTATGPNDKPGGSERLDWRTWDVRRWKGREASLQIVDHQTGGWGHVNIDHILQTDRPRSVVLVTDKLYLETYRPQLHFSPAKNWTNDPNGLVYYQGEYHLFFQHNPEGINWGNMTWGHAISRDLVHWQQLDHALRPDKLGTIFSGSAVVDENNTAGFQTGKEKVLVAIYTSAGGTSPESKGQPFTQSIAYSNDRGRTWVKYAGNPVLKHIVGGNRDPKVLWHGPTKKWVMALYLDGDRYALFGSPDLKQWAKLCDVPLPGASECPDFFELPVDGDPARAKWVFWGGNGTYRLGSFDGQQFRPATESLKSLWGSNDYAAQTYSDIPPRDGRRIQIAWMSGGRYPEMPFNQQMSFPRELSLRTTSEGVRLFMNPVREVKSLRAAGGFEAADVPLPPDKNVLPALAGELWDIRAELVPAAAGQIVLDVRGEPIRYDAKAKTLTCLGKTAPVQPKDGVVTLRVLVDRASIEIFAADGRVTMATCFLPNQADRSLRLSAQGGEAKIKSLAIYPLKSIWQP